MGESVRAGDGEVDWQEWEVADMGANQNGVVAREEYRIPMVIGVTGHIDLEPSKTASLRSEVKAFLDGLKEEYPQTPFLVLTSLAAGADQLVAEVALEVGMRIRAVLPMPEAVYRRAIGEASDGARGFDRLLARSSGGTVVIPLAAGVNEADLAGSSAARDGQYARASAYIVRSCHMLLALWNGVESGKPAGTSRTVAMALRGAGLPGESERRPLDLASGVPVRWILTERIKNTREDNPRTHAEWLYPSSYPGVRASEGGTDVFAAEMTRSGRTYLAELNKELAALELKVAIPGSREAAAVADHVESLIPPPPAEDDHSVHANRMRMDYRESERALAELRARIDYLATRCKRDSRRALVWMLWLVLGGVAGYEVFAHLMTDVFWLLGVYLVLLGAALLVWRHRTHCYRRFLDYRAIAEAVRVQFFWKLAGLQEGVTDYYMRTHRGDVEWIRWAVIGAEVHLGLRGAWPEAQIRPRGVDQATEVWIERQLGYFTGKSASCRRNGRWYVIGSSVLAGLATAVVVTLFVAGVWYRGWLDGLPEHTVHYVTIVVAVLFVGAELVRVSGESEEWTVNAKRYAWMSTVFREAKQGLDDAIDRTVDVGKVYDLEPAQVRAQRVLLELGKEALVENTEWIALHKHRPVELPHAPMPTH